MSVVFSIITVRFEDVAILFAALSYVIYIIVLLARFLAILDLQNAKKQQKMMSPAVQETAIMIYFVIELEGLLQKEDYIQNPSLQQLSKQVELMVHYEAHSSTKNVHYP